MPALQDNLPGLLVLGGIAALVFLGVKAFRSESRETFRLYIGIFWLIVAILLGVLAEFDLFPWSEDPVAPSPEGQSPATQSPAAEAPAGAAPAADDGLSEAPGLAATQAFILAILLWGIGSCWILYHHKRRAGRSLGESLNPLSEPLTNLGQEAKTQFLVLSLASLAIMFFGAELIAAAAFTVAPAGGS